MQWGLTLKKLTKLHLLIVFYISIWGLGILIGRAKSTKSLVTTGLYEEHCLTLLDDETIEYDCSTPAPKSDVAKRWTSRTGSDDEEEVLIFIGTALHKECYKGQEVATRSPT